jgi:O-antigen ligase
MIKKFQILSKIEKFQFGVLLLLIFLLPWMRGGEINWHYQVLIVIIFLLLASVVTVNSLKENKNNTILNHIKNIKTPLILLTAFTLYPLIQVIELPIWLIKILSPYKVEIVENTSKILGANYQQSTTTISISKDETIYDALKQASYLSIFILTMLLINTRKRLLIITWVILLTALSTAIYSIINLYTQGAFLYVTPLPPWHEHDYKTINGPLSYKNHYAAFLVLTIPLGFGLFNYYQNRIKKVQSTRLNIINFVLSVRFLLLIFSTFLGIVLLMNASRAGFIALLLSVFITAFIIRKNINLKVTMKKLVIILFTIIFGIFVTGISDRLINKIETNGDNGRESLRQTALLIVDDYTFFGTGAGTYPIIQNNYKPSNLHGKEMWQHAHNEYLELLATYGIVGVTCLFLGILLILKNILSILVILLKKKSSLLSLQVSYFCSILGMLIHSFADFNFQLPLNAIYFYIILALAVNTFYLKNQKDILCI